MYVYYTLKGVPLHFHVYFKQCTTITVGLASVPQAADRPKGMVCSRAVSSQKNSGYFNKLRAPFVGVLIPVRALQIGMCVGFKLRVFFVECSYTS